MAVVGRAVGVLRRALTGDHDDQVASDRDIARTEPAPMPAADMRKWLDA